MSYIFKNIDVLDLDSSIGVGISIPFNGPTALNTTYTTKDQIKSNLLNMILTGDRERIMNGGFGGGLLGSPGLISQVFNDTRGELDEPTDYFTDRLNSEGFPGVLFNQTTEERVDQIENLIYGGIEKYFPGIIQPQKLSVDLNPDSQSITIYLNYMIIAIKEGDFLVANITQ